MPGDLVSTVYPTCVVYPSPNHPVSGDIETVFGTELLLLIGAKVETFVNPTLLPVRRMWLIISSLCKVGWIYEDNLNKKLIRRG